MAYVARLKKKYNEEVAPALMQKFQYKSVMQIPRIDKIVVSVGCGDCKDNAKMLESVVKDISAITGLTWACGAFLGVAMQVVVALVG